jgi:hypothetical protein
MKVLSHCPKCHGPLLNEAVPTISLPYWTKSCLNKPDHKFIITTVPGNDDLIVRITLQVKTDLMVTWDPTTSKCWVSDDWDLFPHPAMYIPYFEPDLSDYQKLIDKVKLYVLFS